MPCVRRHDDDGFSLVELLVVVIILGSLSAIAGPNLISHRERAWHAAAPSQLRSAVMAVEACGAGQGGSYAAPLDCTDPAQLTAFGYTADPHVTVAPTGVAPTDFSLAATHALLPAAEDTYSYDSTTSAITGPA